ncbi:helix-turn-helix domain-containing protein [Robertmurraya siralis]|uniref:helix-turn-helix domain-containing protein n=1 Tax=Robertmurraya siralis TaxID=77777 RepID=UPI001476FAAE|nr:helix-turn-helix transcriptional regulator [Robertmurraya siralis]
MSGKELKIKRVMLDIKAIEVAQYLHICKSYVSKMENGVQPIPSKIYDKWVLFLGINK